MIDTVTTNEELDRHIEVYPEPHSVYGGVRYKARVRGQDMTMPQGGDCTYAHHWEALSAARKWARGYRLGL